MGGKRPEEGGREINMERKEREETVTPKSNHFTQLLCNTSTASSQIRPDLASILDEVHLKAVEVQAKKLSVHSNGEFLLFIET